MAEDDGGTGRKRGRMFDISVRMVGEGSATSDDGNWDAAEATLTSAFAALPERPERDDPATGRDQAELFAARCADGRFGDAAAVAEQIVAHHRRYYGGYHYRTVQWTGRCGEAHLRAGDPERAEQLIRAALTALESIRGTDDPETRHCRGLLDAALAATRDAS